MDYPKMHADSLYDAVYVMAEQEGAKNYLVCQIEGQMDDLAMPLARLFAAAPAMLEALEQAAKWHLTHRWDYELPDEDETEDALMHVIADALAAAKPEGAVTP